MNIESAVVWLQSLAMCAPPQEPQQCLYLHELGFGAIQDPWFQEMHSCEPSGSLDGSFGQTCAGLLVGQCCEGDTIGARAHDLELWSDSWHRGQGTLAVWLPEHCIYASIKEGLGSAQSRLWSAAACDLNT